MKKLYENIEDIYIKGELSEFTDLITNMDFNLQNIAEATDLVTDALKKYSETNKGRQYEKTVNNVSALREKLYEAAIELNQMQNEVAIYANKIAKYEEISNYSAAVNPIIMNRDNVDVDISEIEFDLHDMNNLIDQINEYIEDVSAHTSSLVEEKDEVGNYWQDSQYRDFAQFIDEIAKSVCDSIDELTFAMNDLERKIEELS